MLGDSYFFCVEIAEAIIDIGFNFSVLWKQQPQSKGSTPFFDTVPLKIKQIEKLEISCLAYEKDIFTEEADAI